MTTNIQLGERQPQRVLVTGATGFIGANLVRALLAQGKQVIATRRDSSSLVRLADVQQEIEWQSLDLLDSASCQDLIRSVRPDCVFHLASTIWATTPPERCHEHFQANVVGTMHLLESIRQHVPETRFVYAGSSASYRPGEQLHEELRLQPNTIYGASKASASILLQSYQQRYQSNVIEVRIFTPYGPWEQSARLIPYCIGQAMAGRPIELSSGKQQRDFIYIDDVVTALQLAATVVEPEHRVLNLGSGSSTTVADIANLVLQVVEELNGAASHSQVVCGARPDRPDEIYVMSTNVERIQRVLNWQPTVELRQGIRQAYQWQRDNQQLQSQLT